MTAEDRDTGRTNRHGIGAGMRIAVAFLVHVQERYTADYCGRAAASLAYTTLLALVPLLTVVLITLSAFPAFKGWHEGVEDFVFRNFVPALGDQVRGYVVQFADKARGLQAAGIGALLVTVLLMMSTIESTFNVIWGVRRVRPVAVRFLVYWAVLTLGPLLVGGGMVVTSYVVSLPLLKSATAVEGLRPHLIAAFPVLVTTVAFVMFFKLIPYRPVSTRHALAGGIVASVLFEFAKRAFAWYVTHFPSHQAVYGAFATVPIFLLWIYLCWVIVLLGAEITHCLETFHSSDPARAGARPHGDTLHCTYRVLLRLYEAQQRGRGVSEKALLAQEKPFGFAAIYAALERLGGAGWVSRNESYEWVLMRDLNRVALNDLIRLVPGFERPERIGGTGADEADLRLRGKLNEFEAWAGAAFDVPLSYLMRGGAADGPGAVAG